jgi:hypothetical protein
MEYRKLVDLTDEEIIFIVQDIFSPKEISNIVRSDEDNEIICDITMTWGDGTEEDPYSDITDELIIT